MEGYGIKLLLLRLEHMSWCNQPKDECAVLRRAALCSDHRFPFSIFHISAKYVRKNILNYTVTWNLISFFTSYSQLLEIKHYHYHHIFVKRLGGT